MQISIDGRIVPAAEASVPVADRGFTLGDGLFETMAVHEGRVLRLEAHLARLRQGLAALRLPLALPDQDLADRIHALVAVNNLREGSLRLTITRGQGPRGLLPADPPRPGVIITASPWASRPTEIAAIIARSTRRNEHSPLSRVKALGYLDSILALIEAQEQGGQEAILLNSAGLAACASAANLFVMRQGKLLTPPVSDGVLPGIVRGEIIARHGGQERSLDPADLAAADEIILSNSLGLRSVVRLDEKPIGAGAAGPVARQLAAAIPFPGHSRHCRA
ncbi:aminotransferase class IV [Rhodoligotrophos defluvii]|uniref:aminotransferase class IV n=1 Tax=Rhodoligotrophos defluvii TaxID=2561934 RepID=UPI0010C9E02F|nr:aminotransferase class IV [Rhodoligotrophos defluvii]